MDITPKAHLNNLLCMTEVEVLAMSDAEALIAALA